MKTLNRFLLLICLIAVGFSSTSCLKDDSLIDWSKLGVVIELPYKNHYLRATKVTPVKNISFDFMVNYTVSYDSDNTEDIPVTIVKDASMIDAYNASLGTSGTYIELPESTYKLPSPVIAKGTRLYKTTIEINTATLSAGKKYIIPIKITGVPQGYTISGNFGHVYLRVDMAN